MPYPSFMAAGATTTPASPGRPTYRTPVFTVEDQEHDQWCWAAVAVSIAANAGQSVSQCSLATTLLGRDCCQTTLPIGANVPHRVDQALNELGVAVGLFLSPFAPNLATVVETVVDDELNAGRPPLAQAVLVGATNHVMLVGALGTDAAGNPAVLIADPSPLHNPGTVEISKLHLYRGRATWTHLGVTRF